MYCLLEVFLQFLTGILQYPALQRKQNDHFFRMQSSQFSAWLAFLYTLLITDFETFGVSLAISSFHSLNNETSSLEYLNFTIFTGGEYNHLSVYDKRKTINIVRRSQSPHGVILQHYFQQLLSNVFRS